MFEERSPCDSNLQRKKYLFQRIHIDIVTRVLLEKYHESSMIFVEVFSWSFFLVAVLVSLYTHQDYSLHLSLILPIDSNNYENNHFPQPHELLPQPIITDLNGDQRNQIIYVTNDQKIRIVDPLYAINNMNTNNENGRIVGRNDIIYEASLSSKFGISSGRRPVALKTGYTTPSGTAANREQVIVVVLDDWSVLCYNSRLKPLWESFIIDDIPKNHYLSEIAIDIIPINLKEGDQGLIVLGGRLEPVGNGVGHKPHVMPAIGIDPKKYMDNDYLSDGEFTGYDPNEEDVGGGEHQGEGHDHKDEGGLHGRDESHFSYYALDAKTGAKRWSHEENDFKPKNVHLDEEYHGEKRHSYKQHIISLMDHEGEVNWKLFKDNMLDQLPHSWSSRYDTKLQSNHFTKSKKSGQSNQGGNTPSTSGTGGKEWENLFGQQSQSQTTQQRWNQEESNVIVSHHRHGIEVIHISSGRTLCKLLLEGTDAHRSLTSHHYIVYVDLDGDGMVDQVHSVTGDPVGSVSSFSRSSRQDVCMGMALAGLPPRDHLFNKSICGWTSQLDFFWPAGFRSSGNSIDGLDKSKRVSYQTVRPAVFNAVYSLRPTHKDTVFLVNSGKINSVNSRGYTNWNIDSPATWSRNNIIIHHPSIQPFNIATQPHQTDQQVLAIGESIVILSASDGSILLQKKIKSISFNNQNNNGNGNNNVLPTAPPIIGDLNQDGINDIIVPTLSGYYIYNLTKGYSTFLFSCFTVIIIATLLVTVILSKQQSLKKSNQNNNPYQLNKRNQSNNNNISNNLSSVFTKNILNNKRSTD
ncbi:hypothetical protein DFA_09466 [Cavenderia fasciculata]|uniref:FG-GAP repeat-containing protein n=1 Tax=Cavenderia fasciculata TaxID=261658 RepID=F4Q7P8_CACFS|nr:uncharacterized protein DFA_09466 [Cavenderia fasciculata]EGG15798.1 hypothetical protein DFA_09466 [Cavenderia fasciculata]|eukprot:XP_004352123.1 hypothetical protein DFA_09466 [Cavenderia fasciculata]